MNGDHPEDNLLIARAFGRPGATASTMIGLNEEAGIWRVTDADGEKVLAVAWPSGPISERPEIRREVVVLYKTACERLGVTPREEHKTAAEHPHGTALPQDVSADESKAFSKVIRETSWSDHSDSEGAGFMDDIIKGRGTKQDYVALVAQHFFMYEALEAAAEQLVTDPAFAEFHPAALVRLGAAQADLVYLIGDDWHERIAPTPATEAYAARIREIAAEKWLPGIVAHHYTRYLGDLSGGQMIAKLVARQHDLTDGGIEFYNFAELGSIPEFKNTYRAGLDRLGANMDETERERFLEEVRIAYGFNTAVFVDLSRQKAAA
ncbi:DUF2470 domain-containing protein [Leucobacter coleopterorum]|uniref:DUF2470 domain-containing protein n=2 Tax=Leucobacter coleopterorum TaxID=2714933 RepID=A0ABX6K392_9MICO|nr:DUF2470 domain-containing protein [Leucobacter coleopterorum]